MSQISPGVYLLWSIMTTLVTTFYFYHLWNYDRFKCLKWNSGPSSQAFKRLMTYSYLSALPMFAIYVFANAVIKYDMGYTTVPGYGIIPTPYQFWKPAYQSALFPLVLMFSLAWGCEIITHLEETLFWFFLINSNSQRDWVRSVYFKFWAVGSVFAILYMPLTTVFTRTNPLKCEVWTFFVGSLSDLLITLFFIPILWKFPSFMRHLETEGVDEPSLVRLTAFHELNRMRFIFRLMFTLPFLLLGADGIGSHNTINTSAFATDLLGMVAAFGCCVSSAITLIIFFPRSNRTEYRARKARFNLMEQRSSARAIPQEQSAVCVISQTQVSMPPVKQAASFVSSIDNGGDDTVDETYNLPPRYEQYVHPQSSNNPWVNQGSRLESIEDDPTSEPLDNESWFDSPLRLQPNRRVDAASAIGSSRPPSMLLPMSSVSKPIDCPLVHPLLKNFKSPIDLVLQSSENV